MRSSRNPGHTKSGIHMVRCSPSGEPKLDDDAAGNSCANAAQNLRRAKLPVTRVARKGGHNWHFDVDPAVEPLAKLLSRRDVAIAANFSEPDTERFLYE